MKTKPTKYRTLFSKNKAFILRYFTVGFVNTFFAYLIYQFYLLVINVSAGTAYIFSAILITFLNAFLHGKITAFQNRSNGKFIYIVAAYLIANFACYSVINYLSLNNFSSSLCFLTGILVYQCIYCPVIFILSTRE